MNLIQKKIVIGTLIIIGLLGVVPPWKLTSRAGISKPYGYDFIMTPSMGPNGITVSIDFSRLIVSWTVVAVLGGAAFFYFRDKDEGQ